MRNKKLLTLSVSICLILVLAVLPFVAACAKPAPAPPPKVWDLKYSSMHPEGSSVLVFARHFGDAVAERTGGQVNVTYYPSGGLVPVKEELAACSKGISDIAALVTAYHASLLPLTDALNIPFCINRGNALATLDELKPVLEPEFTSNNVKLLFLMTTQMFITHRDTVIKDLESFKGEKLNTMPGYIGEALVLWGASLAGIPGSESYMALQRGIMDGQLINAGNYVPSGIYEVAPYVTLAEMDCVCLAYAMNLDLWNSFPSDIQQIITECARGTQEFIFNDPTARALELPGPNIKEWESLGCTVYSITPDERQRWVDAIEPIWGEYLAKVGPSGQKVYDILLKYRE